MEQALYFNKHRKNGQKAFPPTTDSQMPFEVCSTKVDSNKNFMLDKLHTLLRVSQKVHDVRTVLS